MNNNEEKNETKNDDNKKYQPLKKYQPQSNYLKQCSDFYRSSSNEDRAYSSCKNKDYYQSAISFAQTNNCSFDDAMKTFNKDWDEDSWKLVELNEIDSKVGDVFTTSGKIFVVCNSHFDGKLYNDTYACSFKNSRERVCYNERTSKFMSHSGDILTTNFLRHIISFNKPGEKNRKSKGKFKKEEEEGKELWKKVTFDIEEDYEDDEEYVYMEKEKVEKVACLVCYDIHEPSGWTSMCSRKCYHVMRELHDKFEKQEVLIPDYRVVAFFTRHPDAGGHMFNEPIRIKEYIKDNKEKDKTEKVVEDEKFFVVSAGWNTGKPKPISSLFTTRPVLEIRIEEDVEETDEGNKNEEEKKEKEDVTVKEESTETKEEVEKTVLKKLNKNRKRYIIPQDFKTDDESKTAFVNAFVEYNSQEKTWSAKICNDFITGFANNIKASYDDVKEIYK